MLRAWTWGGRVGWGLEKVCGVMEKVCGVMEKRRWHNGIWRYIAPIVCMSRLWSPCLRVVQQDSVFARRSMRGDWRWGAPRCRRLGCWPGERVEWGSGWWDLVVGLVVGWNGRPGGEWGSGTGWGEVAGRVWGRRGWLGGGVGQGGWGQAWCEA